MAADEVELLEAFLRAPLRLYRFGGVMTSTGELLVGETSSLLDCPSGGRVTGDGCGLGVAGRLKPSKDIFFSLVGCIKATFLVNCLSQDSDSLKVGVIKGVLVLKLTKGPRAVRLGLIGVCMIFGGGILGISVDRLIESSDGRSG